MMSKKRVNLYAELKEGLEEMVAIERGQKKPVRVHHFLTRAKMRTPCVRACVSQRTSAAGQRYSGGKRKDSG